MATELSLAMEVFGRHVIARNREKKSLRHEENPRYIGTGVSLDLLLSISISGWMDVSSRRKRRCPAAPRTRGLGGDYTWRFPSFYFIPNLIEVFFYVT